MSATADFKAWARAAGNVILNATTRTWGAFWGTIGAWLLYWAWNSGAPALDRFDPYPFVFLTLLITQASYLQNIVLMTDQRQASLSLEALRAKQWRQEQRMLHLMETVASICTVLQEHAIRSEARDQDSIARDTKILTLLEEVQNGRPRGA